MVTSVVGTDQGRHVLEQVPVKAVDADGVVAFGVGTGLFAATSAVFAWQLSWLTSVGYQWFLWTTLTATGLGLIGLVVTMARRGRSRVSAPPTAER
jgi:hypothetical protein